MQSLIAKPGWEQRLGIQIRYFLKTEGKTMGVEAGHLSKSMIFTYPGYPAPEQAEKTSSIVTFLERSHIIKSSSSSQMLIYLS